MEKYNDLYPQLYSYENLEAAFLKARKRKTLKEYVVEFEADLKKNLLKLQFELETFTYCPSSIKTFVVRDPKTRKISASHFRDRVIHHALCNLIAPFLSESFIYDSFANQKGKGTHKAILRFEQFLRKVTFNHQKTKERERALAGYVLKADIRSYFDTVDHEILFNIIERTIKDPNILWLIRKILESHKASVQGKGMPIGNLTSQFFANVYLNELDQFVKHKPKAKYYLRYVDDFVIFHRDTSTLDNWKSQIDDFLTMNLKLELHTEKSRIIPLQRGITFLGFRIFSKYRLLKKSNARRIWKRLERFKEKYKNNELSRADVVRSLEGWFAYAKFANTYKLRKRVARRFNDLFD